MNKVIVTTTINSPTEALIRFDAMKDWKLVVAGDKKTPADFKLERGIYLSPNDQVAYDSELSDAIGWNCIQRRNFAFLYAYKELKADIVATVDDDNYPMLHWGQSILVGCTVEAKHYATSLPAFDPIGAAGYRHLWHRGYPLELLPGRRYSSEFTATVTPDIKADFWNGDPDIDAICRLEHRPECKFHPDFFPISSNAISPFNSQNTFLSRTVIPHYFMFPGIGRMDDIWASYHVQAQRFKVVYGEPSVIQRRIGHDLIEDMRKEYLGYENNLKIVEAIATDKNAVLGFLPERTRQAFELYQKHFE